MEFPIGREWSRVFTGARTGIGRMADLNRHAWVASQLLDHAGKSFVEK